MDNEACEQELQRELREDNTVELAERWEAPMPDGERAILEAELQQRGYRMASLPAAPPHDAPVLRQPPPTPQERARRAVGRARGALLFVAVMQLLVSAWLGFVAFGETVAADGLETEAEAPLLDARLEVGASVALGLAFAALWLWAREKERPRAAIGIGLALYVGFTALQFVYGPAAGFRGIVVKAIVIALLGEGLRATLSRAWRKPQADAAAPPPLSS